LLDVLLVVLVCKFVIIKNFNFYKLFDGDPRTTSNLCPVKA